MGGYDEEWNDEGDDEGDDEVEKVTRSSMKRYDASAGQWIAVAAMCIRRQSFGACMIAGEIDVTGGEDYMANTFESVEKYSPSSDTWTTVAPFPEARSGHVAVAIGSVMYVIEDFFDGYANDSVLKLDSTQGTWGHVAPMPEESFCVSCLCYRERYLCVWGIKWPASSGFRLQV
jgi:hypothetical protein